MLCVVQGFRPPVDPNLMFHYGSYTYVCSHTTASLFRPWQPPVYHNLKKICIIKQSHIFFLLCSQRVTWTQSLSLYCGTPLFIEGPQEAVSVFQNTTFFSPAIALSGTQSATPGDWGKALTTLLAVTYQVLTICQIGGWEPHCFPSWHPCANFKTSPFFSSHSTAIC